MTQRDKLSYPAYGLPRTIEYYLWGVPFTVAVQKITGRIDLKGMPFEVTIEAMPGNKLVVEAELEGGRGGVTVVVRVRTPTANIRRRLVREVARYRESLQALPRA